MFLVRKYAKTRSLSSNKIGLCKKFLTISISAVSRMSSNLSRSDNESSDPRESVSAPKTQLQCCFHNFDIWGGWESVSYPAGPLGSISFCWPILEWILPRGDHPQGSWSHWHGTSPTRRTVSSLCRKASPLSLGKSTARLQTIQSYHTHSSKSILDTGLSPEKKICI